MDPDVLPYDFLRTKIGFRFSHVLHDWLSAFVNFHYDARLASCGVQPAAL